MLYLIYEGPDRVGKTTTLKLVEKLRNGKDIVIDRFIGSNIVYSLIHKRYDIKEYKKLYNDDYKFVSIFKPVLIYLYAPTKEIIKRMKKDKHDMIDEEILEKTLVEYDKYFDECSYINKIKIDTSVYKQTEVVNLILDYLKYVETK